MHSSDVALGRVVIYRNGVAYYERRATVSGGVLTVSVPRDRVDDFLKSLTVVDAISKQPLPVSIPREQSEDGDHLVMKLQLPTKNAADVVLTYVTESPAWKPSYRVVVGDKGKVMVEGWAIVDNTSGEDWKGVKVGVGSSSALSFKYDLWSVRQVHRETLASEEKFAIAPPTGVSPYGGAVVDGNANGEIALAELDDQEIRRPQGHPEDATAARIANKNERYSTARKTNRGGEDEDEEPSADTGDDGGGSFDGTLSETSRDKRMLRRVSRSRPKKKDVAKGPEKPGDGRIDDGDRKMRTVTQQLLKGNQTIVVEGYGNSNVPDAERRANDRANIVRNRLIDQGVPPARIKVVTRLEPDQRERVRLVAQAPTQTEQKQQTHGGKAVNDLSAQPVGESHFTSPTPMTVERGASAMVSMMRSETAGEVVYLYDAESDRGNASFAFRAVRFVNPTDSTLETGPVTVYGNEKFIGEGLTEPIPPRATAVVPYALDRQIVVERNDGEENRLSRLVTLQRGIVTAEVQHIRRRKMTITNRLREPAKVFIRHTVNKGWVVLQAPKAFERIGDAHLFEIELRPNEVRTVEIAEATPMERTLDLNADVTLDMMRVYADAPDGPPALKEQLKKMLAIHTKLVDLTEESASLRRRLADYKERMDELHGQIVTLQAVKTGNDLMAHLKAKMRDISDRVQKTTIALVNQEEKIMLARVSFQDALAELSLPDAVAARK